MSRTRPNIVLAFADQMRAQATGYAGNRNVRTPNLDALSSRSVNFSQAVAGCPVCGPYRASLMTGQYPLTHGVFLNDVCLSNEAVSLAQACRREGYRTAYIGKWHLDGHGRSNYIPPNRRQGFEFWKVLECTHDYNESHYYAGDSDRMLTWEGYDAIAQTRAACRYVRQAAKHEDRPFLLVLSWGPPHNPYHTAPQRFRDLYDPQNLTLRDNVPEDYAHEGRGMLAGYYAHVSALDECTGRLRETIEQCGLDDDTVFLFTSDHGDMLGSHGQRNKQQPHDEAIRVPFLLRYPNGLGDEPRQTAKLIDAPDVMPTLLSLAGVEVPDTVEGADMSDYARGVSPPDNDAALLLCPSPFGQWVRGAGGREYRGVRTRRYTYVRDLNEPWLLFDNQADPYQLQNLCGRAEYANEQQRLDGILQQKLEEVGDEFLPGEEYIRRWGYVTDEEGTVPYEP